MIDLLAVGHVSRDELPDGRWRLGGSALYAATAAARLGRRTTLVTRIGAGERPALREHCDRHGIDLRAAEAPQSTTFRIRYADGRRSLAVTGHAGAMGAQHLEGLATPRAIVYGSIARELADDLVGCVPAMVAVLVVQGYLRAWADDGTVAPREWGDAEALLRRVSVAVLSEDDVAGDLALPRRWSTTAPVVVTRAEQGALVLERGDEVVVPGFAAARVADPTGAGDVFAAGLALALAEGRPLREAAVHANAVASFAVEGLGTEGLADGPAVLRRLGGT